MSPQGILPLGTLRQIEGPSELMTSSLKGTLVKVKTSIMDEIEAKSNDKE